jgi:RNA polymerase sigma factor (TIGR02999 family)
MRRILVDHARARRAAKRGGGRRRTEFDDAFAVFEERAIDLVALDEVLNRLAEVDERKSRVVELRFFGGLSVEETSRVLNIPLRTVERDWTFAKAWLRSKLGEI